MTDLSCDVAVIGAGTAERAADRSARRTGAATLLIDESFSGRPASPSAACPRNS